MAGSKQSKDCDGQWLLLIGLIIAIGLAVLMIFVNQSLQAGHSSAASIMDFPKNDVREVRAETLREASILGVQANTAPDISQRQQWFADNFTRFTSDIEHIYSAKGALLDIGYIPGVNATLPVDRQRLENLTLHIYYNNGDTLYNETVTTYL